jgi:thiol-disulfide isomerase/thioredoxin
MSVLKQRPFLFGGLAVGAMIILAVAFLPLARERDAAQGGLIGSIAPSLAVDGAPPPTLNGETIDLAAMRGQVVWINFWTTSCIPCRTEMPAMQEKADRYADRGLTIVGVDVGEGKDSVREFVDELGVT